MGVSTGLRGSIPLPGATHVISAVVPMVEPTEREYLEGLRYEDKYPDDAARLVGVIENFVRAVITDAASDDVADTMDLHVERETLVSALASALHSGGGPDA